MTEDAANLFVPERFLSLLIQKKYIDDYYGFWAPYTVGHVHTKCTKFARPKSKSPLPHAM